MTMAIDRVSVGILAGSESDMTTIRSSKLFEILKAASIPYRFDVISSDRDPEGLREYCIRVRGKIPVLIAIAGGVPNLPICAKSWLPDSLVISVPLSNAPDYALAALTTPGDVPVVVTGFGWVTGLEKAARIACCFLRVSL